MQRRPSRPIFPKRKTEVKIDRRLISNFDWSIVIIVLAICLAGIMTIYSSTRPLPGEDGHPNFYLKQTIWVALGIVAMLFVVRMDYSVLGRHSALLYVTGLVLLIVVLFGGRAGMGAQRWISIGPLSFQPSEFFKLFFIIIVARRLSIIHGRIGTAEIIREFFIFAFLPFFLLLKQPDLGTAGIIAALFGLLVASKGISRKAASVILVLCIISLPFMGGIFWEGLKDYQKNRIIAFIDPGIDPAGIGYHINQSKVAIGSGGVFGKGFLKGTQGPFRFLPEKHTDFVFSIFAEEWGFFGSLFLLSLYLALILRGLDTARRAKDPFGRLLAMGITIMFTTYFFLNIGMTMGLLPVVGVPLPFMSYGGTALVSNFIAAGILINIRARRFELFY